jgi:hypothetical protein
MSFPHRRRGVTLLAVAAIAAAVAGYLYGSGDSGSSPAASGRSRSVSAHSGNDAAVRRETAGRSRLGAELQRGVDAAAAKGGTAEAAIMLDGWRTPAIAGSEADGAGRFMRMWSMSKVATMVAVLRGLGWGAQPGTPVSPELDAAFEGAITRSENCRQRRVVLELQRLSGGIAAAREALQSVFESAGAEVRVGTQVAPPEENCIDYLKSQSDLAEPLAPALLLGTSTWRIGDAVRLVHALSLGVYGPTISARVLGLMRLSKQASREVPPGELTAPLDWGAGESLPVGTAYKAGWGGSLNGNFLAGQIALADLPGTGRAAIAVAFHPDQQPPRDDPGITAAAAALDAVFSALSE